MMRNTLLSLLMLATCLLPAAAQAQDIARQRSLEIARSLMTEAERQRMIDSRVERLAVELREMAADLDANRLAHQGGQRDLLQAATILETLGQTHVPNAASAIEEARRQLSALKPNLQVAGQEIDTIIALLDDIRAMNQLDYEQLVAMLRSAVESQRTANERTAAWGQQLFVSRDEAERLTPEISATQRDVHRDVATFAEQLDRLRSDGSAELEPAQRQALAVAASILRAKDPQSQLALAADEIDRARPVTAVKQQREALATLEELLEALQIDNLIEQLQQLQQAMQQIEQIKQQQEQLQEQTEQAEPEQSNELQAQQRELQRQLEQVQMPQPMEAIQQAQQEMQQAQEQLAQQQPEQAAPEQQQATEQLEQALQQMDQQMAQIEQQLSMESPMMAEMRQMQQQQQQLMEQTQQMQQVEPLSQPQQQLAQQMQEMAQQQPEVPEMQQTAELMQQAAEQLQQEKSEQAEQKQQEALQQMAQAMQKVQQMQPMPPQMAQQPQPPQPQPPMPMDGEIGTEEVHNERPGGELTKDDADWQALNDRERGALNQDYAQDLPAEYRQLLEDYYEALSR